MSTQVFRRSSVTVAALVALLLGATLFVVEGTLAPAHGVTGTNSSTVDPGTSFARKVLKIVNKKRANHGKRPLKAQICVSKYARHWGNHLADTNGWEHSNLYNLLDQCNMSAAAENLEKYADGSTPRQVVRAWMGSEGHRRNILNGTYGKTGVAIVWDDDQQIWYAVQNFARR